MTCAHKNNNNNKQQQTNKQQKKKERNLSGFHHFQLINHS